MGFVIARREMSGSQASTVWRLLARAAFLIHVLSWLFWFVGFILFTTNMPSSDHWVQLPILILKLTIEPAMFASFLMRFACFLPFEM